MIRILIFFLSFSFFFDGAHIDLVLLRTVYFLQNRAQFKGTQNLVILVVVVELTEPLEPFESNVLILHLSQLWIPSVSMKHKRKNDD